ncbi:MAG: VWA domain-containing protein [Terriglobales bacterium]
MGRRLHLKINGHLDNKVLFVITDGRDDASRETLKEARQRLQQQNGPTLYAINVSGEDLKPQDREILDSLAESVGGAAFFPQSLDQLNDISRAIGHDIRSLYTIGYRSTNPNPNAGYRTIQVQAQDPGYRQLTVRTRKGYYAGEALR